jgi:hypothetical protein
VKLESPAFMHGEKSIGKLFNFFLARIPHLKLLFRCGGIAFLPKYFYNTAVVLAKGTGCYENNRVR